MPLLRKYTCNDCNSSNSPESRKRRCISPICVIRERSIPCSTIICAISSHPSFRFCSSRRSASGRKPDVARNKVAVIFMSIINAIVKTRILCSDLMFLSPEAIITHSSHDISCTFFLNRTGTGHCGRRAVKRGLRLESYVLRRLHLDQVLPSCTARDTRRRKFCFYFSFIRYCSFYLLFFQLSDDTRGEVREVCLEQHAHDGSLDVAEQLLEAAEPLVLVLDERIALRVACERNLFTQVRHVIDVIHPVAVDGTQRDDALRAVHCGCIALGTFLFV